MKVFLGGTYGDTPWRDELIPLLIERKIDFFNPIVRDWTPECVEIEDREKDICDVHLYYITSEMKGVYSIAEAVESAFKKKCLFVVNTDNFDKGQAKSLNAVANLIYKNGGEFMITWGPDSAVLVEVANRLGKI